MQEAKLSWFLVFWEMLGDKKDSLHGKQAGWESKQAASIRTWLPQCQSLAAPVSAEDWLKWLMSSGDCFCKVPSLSCQYHGKETWPAFLTIGLILDACLSHSKSSNLPKCLEVEISHLLSSPLRRLLGNRPARHCQGKGAAISTQAWVWPQRNELVDKQWIQTETSRPNNDFAGHETPVMGYWDISMMLLLLLFSVPAGPAICHRWSGGAY